MAAKLELESEHFLVCRISGELTRAEMGSFQAEAAPHVQASGQMCFMAVMENFDGWSSEPGWEDASFTEENDQYLKKFAIVGEEQWRDKALMLALAGLRPVPIEFFNDEAAARAWLAED